MHFGVHFPKENVQLCKNAFDAKMHLMRTFCFALQKCIFASNAFLHQQNVTNAFDAALTFCLQNVRKRQNAFWQRNAYILRSKMFSITFSKGKCSAKQNVTNAFDAAVFFAQQKTKAVQKCI